MENNVKYLGETITLDDSDQLSDGHYYHLIMDDFVSHPLQLVSVTVNELTLYSVFRDGFFRLYRI